MSSILGKLQVLVSADTQGLSAGLGDAVKDLEQFTGKMGGLGGKVGTVMLGIGAVSVSASVQVQAALATIERRTGATGTVLQGLQTDFHAVYGSIEEDAGKVAEAVTKVHQRLELSGKPLQDMSKQVLNLSRITGDELDPILETSTRLLGDWSIPATKAGDALDYVFVVSQRTGVGVTALMGKTVQYGAILRGLGYTMDESVALLGDWQAKGVNVETVMAGMREAVKRFAAEGVNAKQGLADLIAKIKESDEVTGMMAARTAVGAEAAADFFDTVRGGKFDVDTLTRSLGDSAGAIDRTAESTETIGDKVAKVWRKVESALAPITAPLLDLAGKVTDVLGRLIDYGTRIATVFGAARDEINLTTSLFGQQQEGKNLGHVIIGNTPPASQLQFSTGLAVARGLLEKVGLYKGNPGDVFGTFDKLFADLPAKFAQLTGMAEKTGEAVDEVPPKLSAWEQAQQRLGATLDAQKGNVTELLEASVKLDDELDKTAAAGANQTAVARVHKDEILALAKGYQDLGIVLPAQLQHWVALAQGIDETDQKLAENRKNLDAARAAFSTTETQLADLDRQFIAYVKSLKQGVADGTVSQDEYNQRLAKADEWYQRQQRSIQARDEDLLRGLEEAKSKEEERNRRQQEYADWVAKMQAAEDSYWQTYGSGVGKAAYLLDNQFAPALQRVLMLHTNGWVSQTAVLDTFRGEMGKLIDEVGGDFSSLDDLLQQLAARSGVTVTQMLTAWAGAMGLSIDQVKKLLNNAWSESATAFENSFTKRVVDSLNVIADWAPEVFGDAGSAIGAAINTFSRFLERELGNMKETWKKHWEAITAMGLRALGAIFGGDSALGSAFSGAAGGVAIGAALGTVIPGVGNIAGGIIGGGLGFLGGLFGGGDDSAEQQKRAEEAAARQAAFEKETEDVLRRFQALVAEAMASGTAYSDEMAAMWVDLTNRGVDLTDVVEGINSAIEDQAAAIREAEAALDELPGQIYDAQIALDKMHDSLAEDRAAIHQARRELFQLSQQPGGLSFRPADTNRFFKGERGYSEILAAIEAAKGKDSKLGAYITTGETKDILRGAGNDATALLIEQLVKMENAAALQQMQIANQVKSIQQQQNTLDTLKHNLPLMRDRLASLEQFKADFGSKGFDQLHRDLGGIADILRAKFPEYAEGGPVAKTGMALVHAGEFVLSKAMLDAGKFPLANAGNLVLPKKVSGMAGAGGGMTLNMGGFNFYAEHPSQFKNWIEFQGGRRYLMEQFAIGAREAGGRIDPSIFKR